MVFNNNAPVFGAPLEMLGYNWWAEGCFSDSTSSRTLPHIVSLSDYGGASNLTLENGLRACSAKGYIWCGFEYGQEVYGVSEYEYFNLNTSRNLATTEDGEAAMVAAGCNYKCTGNSNQACGGSNRMMVYGNDG